MLGLSLFLLSFLALGYSLFLNVGLLTQIGGIIGFVIFWKIVASFKSSQTDPSKKGRVLVICLGDIGRSPRMTYHCVSLAKAGFQVDYVAYRGAKPHEMLLESRDIVLHQMAPYPYRIKGAPFILNAPLKIIYQLSELFLIIFGLVSRPDYILIQNPPAIPTLLVAHVVAFIRSSKLIIDWHNFGYTILGLALGSKHPLVGIAYWYERIFGRGAHGNLCVCKAMQTHLTESWKVNASVLYDRPPAMFHQLSTLEKHNLWLRLQEEEPWTSIREWIGTKPGETIFTRANKKLRSDRPALVISSTSWTADEDFSIFLAAIQTLDRHLIKMEEKSNLRLVFAITGKGPQKEMYEQLIAKLPLVHCRIVTAWLAAEDYPRILGASDLGVSLHKSSSGLDLPMKVVDMFGAGLPVCAITFPCLDELVQHQKNGLVFESSADLTAGMFQLLHRFPQQTKQLDEMREIIKEFQALRWDECWDTNALPLFES